MIIVLTSLALRVGVILLWGRKKGRGGRKKKEEMGGLINICVWVIKGALAHLLLLYPGMVPSSIRLQSRLKVTAWEPLTEAPWQTHNMRMGTHAGRAGSDRLDAVGNLWLNSWMLYSNHLSMQTFHMQPDFSCTLVWEFKDMH